MKESEFIFFGYFMSLGFTLTLWGVTIIFNTVINGETLMIIGVTIIGLALLYDKQVIQKND